MVFKDDTRMIKIPDEVLATIIKYRQCDNNSFEAGGVLIGRENVSNNNLIIEYASEPMPRDQRNRYRFYRKDKGHLELYHNLYNTNQGVYVYVGEWHTHPESIPNYSSIDYRNWKKISNHSKNEQAQYHLIAGFEALRIWKCSRISQIAKELITMRWKDSC